MSWIHYGMKAVYAGAVAFLGGLITAVQAGTLNTEAWLIVVLTTVLAVGGVFRLSNGPNPSEQQRVDDHLTPTA